MNALAEALAARTLLGDPATLAAALVAVVFFGLSKGGLGGGFALIGVAVLAMVLPPVQAAALLLPVLLMMDAVGLWTWRGWYDRAVLSAMLPAALLGIGIGALTAAVTPEAAVRLIVGLVALGFVARVLLRRVARPGRKAGWFWGAVAGFTSFVAHAGGPPFQVYALPLKLDPKVLTGTSVIFFAVVNTVKVAPYAALGFFDARTLLTAGVLLPVAVVAVLAGAAVVKRMRAEVFYPFMYATVALVGLRLVWDGAKGLIGG
ncbi:sulfite exporter TauE/SafE family protein [Pararhodobacter sp. SW119]|uniref:sulfite exporter TauE/SafE family protein n=1 Tax=Pararhodobacter sp. SW119 TaxID=2780075 RepID=UPI001FD78FE5|nr:sulfite exporter TauE/SafE family protein [Pararhodobacter sp. SW119]